MERTLKIVSPVVVNLKEDFKIYIESLAKRVYFITPAYSLQAALTKHFY